MFRRVHGCCRCRHCSFTAADTTSLLDHFNSVHCQDSGEPGSAPANGCSAPSTVRIKEESKSDLKLYSLVPPEARPAEAVKTEAPDEKEKEKSWPEARGGTEQQIQGMLWVPKERVGEVLRGSPAPFPHVTLGLLSSTSVPQEQQQKGAAVLRDSPGLVFSLSADAKGYLQGTPAGTAAEKPRQQYPSSTEGKSSKEESQSLLRVRSSALSMCPSVYLLLLIKILFFLNKCTFKKKKVLIHVQTFHCFNLTDNMFMVWCTQCLAVLVRISGTAFPALTPNWVFCFSKS